MIVTVSRAPLTDQNLMNLLGQNSEEVQKYKGYLGPWQFSATWLALADGVEAAAIGTTVPHLLGDEPYFWMIHTKICEQHPLRFIRWSRRVVSEVLTLYPAGVIGLCHNENPAGKRWLRWLGATFDGSHIDDLDAFRITHG